jgi:hypothetical protein
MNTVSLQSLILKSNPHIKLFKLKSIDERNT